MPCCYPSQLRFRRPFREDAVMSLDHQLGMSSYIDMLQMKAKFDVVEKEGDRMMCCLSAY